MTRERFLVIPLQPVTQCERGFRSQLGRNRKPVRNAGQDRVGGITNVFFLVVAVVMLKSVF